MSPESELAGLNRQELWVKEKRSHNLTPSWRHKDVVCSEMARSNPQIRSRHVFPNSESRETKGIISSQVAKER